MVTSLGDPGGERTRVAGQPGPGPARRCRHLGGPRGLPPGLASGPAPSRGRRSRHYDYPAPVATNRARGQARPLTDIVPELARRFLTTPEPPVRLPTTRDLAHDHRSSLASIHVAMGRLEEAGGIAVETRGRLGAFMVDRSVGRLWATAENGPLVIGLPLASSPRYEALATAIKQLLTNAGLEVFLIFVRGSRQRLQAVRDGRCHLTVMSSFAAAELCGPQDAIVSELGIDSYNTGHRVFYSSGRPDPHPIRVIVDRHSADQQLLTALEFSGDDVTLVPAMPAQISRLLDQRAGRRGRLDRRRDAGRAAGRHPRSPVVAGRARPDRRPDDAGGARRASRRRRRDARRDRADPERGRRPDPARRDGGKGRSGVLRAGRPTRDPRPDRPPRSVRSVIDTTPYHPSCS